MPSLIDSPAFPLELEREIFTTAAIIHEETIPTLLRVAHRVLIWIEPLFYRTLVFGDTAENSHIPRLSAAVQTIRAKSPDFIRQNVRGILWLERSSAGEREMRTLLSICTGVQNLVLRALTFAMIPLLEPLQLRRLTLLSEGLLPILETFAALRLTHLHLHFILLVPSLHLPWIRTLPSLTHLCFSNPPNTDPLVHAFLRGNTKLQVLVWAHSDQYGYLPLDADAWSDDPRVVLLRSQLDICADDYSQDWKLGVAGGPDFWVRAEEFLAKKRSDKSIKTQFYDLEWPNWGIWTTLCEY
ncbi:hypothetical protein B0H13DRAFT_2444602 [Mycena leptocephala]|nr:hypothetical protein B0H13DRAFT_2444602 [Mycena leptocephala]